MATRFLFHNTFLMHVRISAIISPWHTKIVVRRALWKAVPTRSVSNAISVLRLLYACDKRRHILRPFIKPFHVTLERFVCLSVFRAFCGAVSWSGFEMKNAVLLEYPVRGRMGFVIIGPMNLQAMVHNVKQARFLRKGGEGRGGG